MLISSYKEIIDTQHYLFYIILLNYVRSILFYGTVPLEFYYFITKRKEFLEQSNRFVHYLC